jgi:hypothetical protein
MFDSSSASNRRQFLKFMGHASLSIGAASLLGSELMGCASKTQRPPPPFMGLKPTYIDKLELAPGFKYETLIKWNTPINSKESFGSNNDFLAYTALAGKTDEGILWVNHESISPVLLHNRKMDTPRTKEEVITEQLAVGGSLIHIRKDQGQWKFVADSKYNRRITARTPIPFQKSFKIMGSTVATGTLANCAGGITPWQTFLTCEENYENFYGDATYVNKKRVFVEVNELKWYNHFPLPPEHYGWVVEVHPLTGQAQKLNSLGRFEHEGAKVQMSRNGFPIVYMGEDRKGGCIFKFISSDKKSLTHGTLYVADTKNGRWIPLDLQKTKVLKKHFDSQQDVLTYASYAAQLAGGTPQDRPEDIEIDPIHGGIFVSLTNNEDKGNYHGSLFKISEKNGDYEAMEFQSETWLAGGLENGFSCPDNLVFDQKGNLWVTVDMSEKEIETGVYKGQGNNGLYFIPMEGAQAGRPILIASAPKDAEFTGPMFSEDYKTLFLSVQHPGLQTTDPRTPTSHWPDGPGTLPKSAVVMITGPLITSS